MSSAKYQHILRAVYERPWAILPSTLALIVDVVRFRASGGVLTDEEIQARISAAQNGPRAGGRQTGTVAVIPVYGPITQRQNLVSASSGGTSIEQLNSDFRGALADQSVDAIVLEFDSPGGTIDGVDELASEMRAARGKKPVIAHVNTMAASAAYWLAVQCDEVVVTPTGAVGSIGVFTAHQDLSAAAEQEGVKTTLISAGKYKTEGNQWEPLSADAKASLQDQVDQIYGMFVSAVAKGRGVPVDSVRNGYGEGRVVLAKQAVAQGMADSVDTLDNTIRRAGRMALAGNSRQVAASADVRRKMLASVTPDHISPTLDGPYDDEAEIAKLAPDAGEEVYEQMFAWADDSADPDAVESYLLAHHFVIGDQPGAASVAGCGAAIAELNSGTSGVPDADREEVHDHLMAHLLYDAGEDSDPDEMDALDSGRSFASRVALVSAQADRLVEHAKARADMRGKTRARGNRSLSVADRDHLRGAAEALVALADAGATPQANWTKGAALRLALARAKYDIGDSK